MIDNIIYFIIDNIETIGICAIIVIGIAILTDTSNNKE